MDDIVTVRPVDAEAELDRLARQYRSASGPGIQMLNLLGGKAENLIDRLPSPVRAGLFEATEQALHVAMRAADHSRRAVPDQRPWVNTAMTTAMGAAGGFGGLPGSLVELPATTTVLLRAIQSAAVSEGFDPGATSVQFDCVRVFSSAGPLAHDDGADLGFVTLRLSLTGHALHKLIAAVTPRLAAAMGQKLAAQSVPVLGAMAGAGSNYVYTRYYQDMARVHFGLRRLAIDSDRPHDELVSALADKVARIPRR